MTPSSLIVTPKNPISRKDFEPFQMQLTGLLWQFTTLLTERAQDRNASNIATLQLPYNLKPLRTFEMEPDANLMYSVISTTLPFMR
jgi:hypothetical protein